MDAIRSATRSVRVIIYARVSTDDQADKGYSLPTQIENCRKYAERLGFTVVAEFSEDCSGVIPIAERPEGKKAIAMLKQKKADAIIASQVDRLGRDDLDVRLQVRIWLRDAIQVHTCDMGQIKTDLDIVLVIKSWQSADEKEKIKERTMRGRYGKAQNGKVVGASVPPYGYHFAKDQNNKVISLQIYEPEARVVRLIHEYYVRDRLPMYRIAAKLSEMGLPLPSEGKGVRKLPYNAAWDDPIAKTTWHYTSDPNNRKWSRKVVRLILSNELYCGVWHYGQSIGHAGRGGRRDPQDHIRVNIPAIVSRETWQAAKAQCEENKATAMRNSKFDYMLRGHIRCGDCGGGMVGAMAGRNLYRYYRCIQTTEHHADCRARMVRIDALETQVKEWLKAKMENAEDIEGILRDAQKEEEDGLEPKQEQLAVLLEQMTETEREARETAEALRQLVKKDGIIAKSLQDKADSIESEYAGQIKKRDELQTALVTRLYTEENIERALQFREDFAVGLENPSNDNLRHSLAMLQLTVVVQDGQFWFERNGARESREIEIPSFFGMTKVPCSARASCRTRTSRRRGRLPYRTR